jgi:alkanesulfonate monooxygenase SsuD/methylene tetrahydromethanopterin reductase-like flavin-dependent oxidoreductase (luciferase family)
VTALAPLTSRIRLGCLVSPVSFRHPAILLRQMQSLDVISDGRAIVGLGAGWDPDEHHEFGFEFSPTPERLRALDDACAFITERWATIDPRPLQQPAPVLVAGASPAALRIAARHAVAWNGLGTPAYMADRIAALRAAEIEVGRAGPPVEATLNLIAVLADDAVTLEKVRARLATTAVTRVAKAQARMALPTEADAPGMFVGRPSELRDEIARYAAVGVQRVILTLPRPFSASALESLARSAGVV